MAPLSIFIYFFYLFLSVSKLNSLREVTECSVLQVLGMYVELVPNMIPKLTQPYQFVCVSFDACLCMQNNHYMCSFSF